MHRSTHPQFIPSNIRAEVKISEYFALFLKPCRGEYFKLHSLSLAIRVRNFSCFLIAFFFWTLFFTSSPSWAQTSQPDGLFGSKALKVNVVTEVLRPDLILLESGQQIRLIGLQAPEPPPRFKIHKDQKGISLPGENPESSWEELAYIFTLKFLEGKKVRLEFDSEAKDSQLHTYAYVYLWPDNVFVNEEILKKGFAALQIRPPNTKYAQRLRAAYQEARREKRGLHGE